MRHDTSNRLVSRSLALARAHPLAKKMCHRSHTEPLRPPLLTSIEIDYTRTVTTLMPLAV